MNHAQIIQATGQDESPPILRVNRRQYYSVLAKSDSGNTNPLENFVGRAVEGRLYLYIAACKPAIKSPKLEEDWILLREACVGTPYSQEYLSLLARLGRIAAIKRGRNWYTTRRAIKAYQESLISPLDFVLSIYEASPCHQSIHCPRSGAQEQIDHMEHSC